MLMYKKKDIILVKFPFTNLQDFKLSPALIVWEYKDDFIILAISSNKKNGINCKIEKKDMVNGEMLVDSYVKVNKITSIEKSIIYSKIWTIEKQFFHDVKQKFVKKVLD